MGRMIDLVFWNFANLLERFVPWRWSQFVRHGPHNVALWIRGRRPAGPWIEPKGTPSPMGFLEPLSDDERRRIEERVALEGVETPGLPS